MSGLPKGIPYTKVPNFIIEDLMADLRGGELKVAIAICRKTFGFHKKTDGIALSQIMDLTGLTKKTVIDSLRSLVKKKVIRKSISSTPYQYSIDVSNHIDAIPQKHKTTKISPKNLKPDGGIKTTPQEVQKLHRSGVQKLNPQKKSIKEIEKNTTSSSDLSDEIVEVIETWNNTFERKMSKNDKQDIEIVRSALKDFSVDQICKAIFNRSQAQYYKTIPWHRDNPEMFFCIPEYIRNDLQRRPKDIYTFEEMTTKVGKTPGMTTDYFEMIPNMKDEMDRPLWKPKVSNS
ncbi:replication protein [Halalkalibaculum sp. DA384]|uniref:replication protein n=1 Tax=Halalkalibaculum sp. DA384 TaxID=3373606 RepID=UPI0037543D06